MIIRQISVFLENDAGKLTEVTNILAENNIDLKAISIAETNDYGIIRLITNDNTKAANILIENDFVLSVTEVVQLGVNHAPGGLNSILQKIAKANINIEYMYTIFGLEDGQAGMIFKVDNPEKLDKIL